MYSNNPKFGRAITLMREDLRVLGDGQPVQPSNCDVAAEDDVVVGPSAILVLGEVFSW